MAYTDQEKADQGKPIMNEEEIKRLIHSTLLDLIENSLSYDELDINKLLDNLTKSLGNCCDSSGPYHYYIFDSPVGKVYTCRICNSNWIKKTFSDAAGDTDHEFVKLPTL
jgi:hypothetical protein